LTVLVLFYKLGTENIQLLHRSNFNSKTLIEQYNNVHIKIMTSIQTKTPNIVFM